MAIHVQAYTLIRSWFYCAFLYSTLMSNLKQEIMYKKLLYAISEGQGSFDLSWVSGTNQMTLYVNMMNRGLFSRHNSFCFLCTVGLPSQIMALFWVPFQGCGIFQVSRGCSLCILWILSLKNCYCLLLNCVCQFLCFNKVDRSLSSERLCFGWGVMKWKEREGKI